MEGNDSDWTRFSDLNYITYNNLPAGNYVLRVRMDDGSGSQIIDERSLNIHITPPFWKTWWFSLIIVVFVTSFSLYLLKEYSDRLKQKHDKDKIRFFTNMVHDIRTSLTLIQAPINQLERTQELSTNSRYYLDLASEQSQKLSSVATQLLDFEKVDSGKGQLFLVQTDVVLLISKRIQIFNAAASEKGINLQFSSNKKSYTVSVDELKIEKVIDNLVSNAIKYSHSNGRVEINLTCKADEWTLEIKDYGLGISNHAKSKLFKEFYRGDNPANSKIVGSGIGLLLVKNYVTMHGGKVLLQSKENEGSSFTIAIPNEEVTNTSPDENSVFSFSEENGIEPDTATSQRVQKQAGRMNILVVEDNTNLQDFLVHSLSEFYNVSKAGDGIEAMQIIKRNAPDLIISDIMMPNMDGFELCKQIKSTFETSHIPIILLTSLSEKAKQLEGLGLGAEDYVTKPFDLSILLQRINSILRNREIVRERAMKFFADTDKEQLVFSNELNDKFIKKAFTVVNKNLSNSEFGKNEFASSMHVSPSLLYQKIKSLTGQSPIDFIKTIRFNQSLELLRTHNYSITEISEMCGFSSSSYFTTSFRKHFGKSPTEFLH